LPSFFDVAEAWDFLNDISTTPVCDMAPNMVMVMPLAVGIMPFAAEAFWRATMIFWCVQIKPCFINEHSICKSPSADVTSHSYDFVLSQIHDSVRISCCGNFSTFFNVTLHFCTNAYVAPTWILSVQETSRKDSA
jgi:hypothetical protein